MMKDIGYHRHVVSMLACCTKGECLALVMEYIPYGNLQSFLKKKRAESEVKRIELHLTILPLYNYWVESEELIV